VKAPEQFSGLEGLPTYACQVQQENTQILLQLSKVKLVVNGRKASLSSLQITASVAKDGASEQLSSGSSAQVFLTIAIGKKNSEWVSTSGTVTLEPRLSRKATEEHSALALSQLGPCRATPRKAAVPRRRFTCPGQSRAVTRSSSCPIGNGASSSPEPAVAPFCADIGFREIADVVIRHGQDRCTIEAPTPSVFPEGVPTSGAAKTQLPLPERDPVPTR